MGKYAKPSPECGVNSTTVKLATSLGLRSTGLCFLGTCYFVYQLGYLPHPNYRIFTADILSVSSFLSASNIFLIVILLDPPHFLVVRWDWSFRDHLSRALPTERIFYLLRSIRSERLIRDNSEELLLDALEIIIN